EAVHVGATWASNNCSFCSAGAQPNSREAIPSLPLAGHTRPCKDGWRGASPFSQWIVSSEALLEILLRPAIQPLQRLVQVFKRVSHTESQIALAKIAERRSRQASDASIFQQSVRKLLGFPVSLRNVGKHVERAFGHA